MQGACVSPEPRYDEPFAWWGPAWQVPEPRDIAGLLRDETIDSWTAANLWAALTRRRSLVVVAGESKVGKTTLLSALLDFLPPNTRRVYPRGCFESFAFLSDPKIDPSQTALLINEISPHLPVYLWGPAVGRILEAAQRGFTLLATAHADSVHEFVGGLTGSPLRIPLAQVAAFEFIVVMKRDEANLSGRRVCGVWRLAATRSGIDIAEMPPVTPPLHDISIQTNPDHDNPATWFPLHELARRRHILDNLRERHDLPLPIASLFPNSGPRELDP
jgi:energy-coupling factor transporter ATP-binding protein EcfA2